ncbi:YolD-like family protein [Caldifermentibacillus hisashii]|uniref:YolD-like family protein n=1 Tax=Caldifermentibacillus hisashii TaxID=996558 RepID=A0ABU9JZ94_9BACI
MLKDRGTKKWQGFFLTEHVSMLKKMDIEDRKVRKPVLDEQQKLEINDLLVLSLQDGEPIQITLWLDGFIEEIGPFTITKIAPYKRRLYGLYKGGNHSFSFDSLIGAKRI